MGNAPFALAAADLNGDLRPDLVVARFGPDGISVLMNDARGAFAAPVGYDVPPTLSVVISDLNGDKTPDLAATGGTGLSILLGTGGGDFRVGQHHDLSSGAWGVAAADLDLDGIPDLAVTSSQADHAVWVLINQGDATFSPPLVYDTITTAHSVVSADFNIDQAPDLAMSVSGANSAVVLLNKGDGTFASAVGTVRKELCLQPGPLTPRISTRTARRI